MLPGKNFERCKMSLGRLVIQLNVYLLPSGPNAMKPSPGAPLASDEAMFDDDDDVSMDEEEVNDDDNEDSMSDDDDDQPGSLIYCRAAAAATKCAVSSAH